MKKALLLLPFTVMLSACQTAPRPEVGAWFTLFDGETLDGWRASENPDSVRIEDGVIVCNGDRSHVFYVGPDGNASFKNFEFEAEVMTTPGSNSGIYFHTEYQETGWPSKGYEAQVFNSHTKADGSVSGERKMTGSLYGIRNVWKAPVGDNEWFKYRIRVEGKTIRIWINDALMSDYTEPAEPWRSENTGGRVLSEGTIALQVHDPGSTAYYRNLRIMPLADDLPTPGEPLEDAELDRRLTALAGRNLPLMDLHVHLKQDLTLEDALANARRYGLTYGIAVNCGLGMPVTNEEDLKAYLAEYAPPPGTFMAMQAEGREWLELFSEESIAQFDYVFTDSMTWSNRQGKRMRLWIDSEVEIGNVQSFMDLLVERTVGILDNEPIDIYVNPTYIPDRIGERYDELWTETRMQKVIDALVRNEVALEINDVRRIPSAEFIKRAKAAGVKFTFGTNNAGADDLGYLAYPLEMIEECGLEPSDMWIPYE